MTEPLSIYQREVWTTFDHHLRWSVFCRILHAIIILRYSLMGEEWWRVAGTLHLAKRPVYRGLRGKGEEWRVFGKILCRYILLQHTATTPLSLHSFYLFSECDCKSTRFPRRIHTHHCKLGNRRLNMKATMLWRTVLFDMAIVTSDKDRRWGISIFTSWKELFAMSERVSSRVGESIIQGARK